MLIDVRRCEPRRRETRPDVPIFPDRHLAQDYGPDYQQLLSRLLKPHPGTLIIVVAAYDRRSPRSLLIAPCSVPRPVVPEPRVVLRSTIRNSSDRPEPVAERLSAPP